MCGDTNKACGDLPAGLAVAAFALSDNCMAISTDRLSGRAAPWRPWRSSARRATAGMLACCASRIRPCRKASRSPDSARMPASTSFADRHDQLWNGQPAGSGELRDREPPPRLWVATRSARPGIPRKRGVTYSPRREPRSAHRRGGPAGFGHDYALLLEAIGELDEQERVAVNLLDCVLPARPSMFSPEWVSAPGAATWLESAT